MLGISSQRSSKLAWCGWKWKMLEQCGCWFVANPASAGINKNKVRFSYRWGSRRQILSVIEIHGYTNEPFVGAMFRICPSKHVIWICFCVCVGVYESGHSPVPAPSGTYSFHPKAGGMDKMKLYSHVRKTKKTAHEVVIFLAVNGLTTKKHRCTETAASATICSIPVK